MADSVMREYSTIEEYFESETVVKKSRFIGQLYPAKDFDEAATIIAASKKRFYDAGHGCTAMIFGYNRELMRCSDAGEPQGTAGVPMLDALKGSGLTNVLAIVTRYFGGTLLGTGGLVRAYTGSVQETLKLAKIVTYTPMEIYTASVPFKLWGKTEAMLKSEGIIISQTDYMEDVKLKLCMKAEKEEALLKNFAEITAGKSVPVKTGSEYMKIYRRID